MSGTFWFGWACGAGGAVLGQAGYHLWRLWWSRSARARRYRIAVLEYDLGLSDKPITDAQRRDHHVKSVAAMYSSHFAARRARVNGDAA